jgi:hypothetical protein
MEKELQQVVTKEQHPASRRWAIFEDDGVSAWLYLTEPEGLRPVADCWVYNRVAAPQAHDIQQYRGGPPPACSGYAGPDAQYLRGEPAAASFLWCKDGEAVSVVIDGAALAFVEAGRARGFSRHLLKSGPWGNTWDEHLFQRLFGMSEAAES